MPKKYYCRVISFIFLASSLDSLQATAQLVRLSQGFDNYIGSVATVPSGWYISWNSTSSPSYYITAGNYGSAIPSYKFGNDRDSIISPYFLSADTLKFWCKGQGAFSAQNSLSILYSSDSANWYTLENTDSLPVVETTLTFALSCDVHYLMFVYNKVSGNLAFDDVLVTMTDYFPAAVAATTLNLHCAGDTVCFFDMSTMDGCDSIVSRTWDFGDSTATDSTQNPCHLFAQAGNYAVALIVTASNGNNDTAYLNITVNPLPVAQFSYINTSGTLVDFTDSSSVLNGNIISWFWNFGDSTLSIQQNPVHSFASAGTYFTCLTVTSGLGCSSTVCDSVYVVGAGIEDLAEEFPGMFLSPNPVQNEFLLYMPGAGKLLPRFEIFDLAGNSIPVAAEYLHEQKYRIMLPDVADGVYILKISAGHKTAMQKVLVAK